MKRTHWHPSYCHVCGRSSAEVGPISQTGKCPADSRAALVSNIEQMVARSGPNFTRWRQRMAASVGAALLDDTRPDAQTAQR